LPFAITSGGGSAAATALDALHKNRVTRIAGPSHRCLRIDRSPVFGSIAAKSPRHVVSLQHFSTTHQQKASAPLGTKLRFA
jgi:hypothetical protein